MNDFDIPEDVTGRGRKAAEAIIALLKKNGSEPNGGGCRAFYSPTEWKNRGERYGTSSLLVIVHDGGDACPYFNIDYGNMKLWEEMQIELAKLGLYAEMCTGWYSAVYVA